MCKVLEDNQQPTYCAGYGGAGTWAIDEYGIAYEWAQNNAAIPYSDLMYRRGAKEIAIKCKLYGIPPVFLSLPSQTGPVPKGIVRHDRCENGAKLGKSDPGNQFNEALFLSYLTAELEEDDMALTPRQEAALEEMAKLTVDSYTDSAGRVWPSKMVYLMAHTEAFDIHRIVWLAGKA
jgi:hypothetical protein